MTKGLYLLAKFIARHKYWAIIIWIAVIAGVATWAVNLNAALEDDYSLPGTQSQDAEDALLKYFPTAAGSSANIVFQSDQENINSSQSKQFVGEVLEKVSTLDGVVTVSNPYLGGNGQTPYISPNNTAALASVNYSDSAQIDSETTDQLTDTVNSFQSEGQQIGITSTAGGDIYFITAGAGSSDTSSEILGLIAAVVILVVAFGSIVAMGLPLISALTGLGLGVSIVFTLANFFQVSSIGPTIATMIGLGVGIDYSLFIVKRYREYLNDGYGVEESVGRAVGTAGQAVIVAGITVIIALLGLLLIDIPIMSSIAYAAAITVGGAVIIANTFLPALLSVFGKSIEKINIHKWFNTDGFNDNFARRWGTHVVINHPFRIGFLALAILILLIIPIKDIELGPPGENTVPESNPQRIVYNIVEQEFGAGYNGPLLMVTEFQDPSNSQENMLNIQKIELATSQADDVATILPATFSQSGQAAVWAVIPKSAPSSQATEDLIDNLRNNVVPQASSGTDSTTYVGGLTAEFVDMSQKITDKMPMFMGAVIGLAFILLVIAFRSLVVPTIAAIMIALTALATFGVMVAIFQWGWLSGLIGLTGTGPLVSYVPIMVFAIIFGLSMDYEIFLVSRIREKYLESKDNDESIVYGISKTARVIIAAALIMFCVFASFNTQSNAVIKMFGTGLAVAILIDVLLGRMILVPVAMHFTGKSTWWFPKWLSKIVPDMHFEDSSVFDDKPKKKSLKKKAK